MSGRTLMPMVCFAVWAAGAAQAEDRLEGILAQLRAENYTEIEIRRTFLGRIRVNASGSGRTREIIVNPSTGAVMRDYSSGQQADTGPVPPRSQTGGPPATPRGRDRGGPKNGPENGARDGRSNDRSGPANGSDGPGGGAGRGSGASRDKR